MAFNLAIFTASIFGAALLTVFDGLVLPVVMVEFGLAALRFTVYRRSTAFPVRL